MNSQSKVRFYEQPLSKRGVQRYCIEVEWGSIVYQSEATFLQGFSLGSTQQHQADLEYIKQVWPSINWNQWPWEQRDRIREKVLELWEVHNIQPEIKYALEHNIWQKYQQDKEEGMTREDRQKKGYQEVLLITGQDDIEERIQKWETGSYGRIKVKWTPENKIRYHQLRERCLGVPMWICDGNQSWEIEQLKSYQDWGDKEKIILEEALPEINQQEDFFKQSQIGYALDESLTKTNSRQVREELLGQLSQLEGLSYVVLKPARWGGIWSVWDIIERYPSLQFGLSSFYETRKGIEHLKQIWGLSSRWSPYIGIDTLR